MFCPGCGREGNEGEIYCGNCGRKLPWEKMAQEELGNAATEQGMECANDVAARKRPIKSGILNEVGGNEKADDAIVKKEKVTEKAFENQEGNPEKTSETQKETREGVSETTENQNDSPEETTPEQEALEQATPEQAIPEQEAPEQPTPEQEASEQPAPEQKTPERPMLVLKRSTIKKVFFGVAGFIAAVIFLVCCLGGADIRNVKNGILEDYNYGVSIGDALHTWFDGTERWDSYSENGVTYITARGWTKYTLTKKMQEQIFVFHNLGGDAFVFDGIFDTAGDYLYLGNGNVDLLDLGGLISYGLYEQTLKAAFGDKETLQLFIEME